jgi:hypothetical protein
LGSHVPSHGVHELSLELESRSGEALADEVHSELCDRLGRERLYDVRRRRELLGARLLFAPFFQRLLARYRHDRPVSSEEG